MRQSEKVITLAFSVLFGITLLCPLLGYVFGKYNKMNAAENRMLAEFPSAHGSSAEIIAQTNNYINDHMGFRRDLINLDHFIEKTFNAIGLSSNKIRIQDALIGDRGWLFYVGSSGMDDISRYSYISEEQLHDMEAALKQKAEACHDEGCTFLFVVVPDKQSVYPEYLPAGILGSGPSRLDVISAELNKDALLSQHFLSLVPELVEAKKRRLALYYETDSHWNAVGSFYGYKSIIEKLQLLDGPFITVLFDPSHFTAVPKLNGDLNGMTGLHLKDDNFIFPGDESKVQLCTFWRPRELDFPDPGWTFPFVRFNPEAPVKKTVFVLCDSFGEFIGRYLSQTFQKVVIETDQDNPSLEKTLNRLHPDIVLEIKVERYLSPDSQDSFGKALEHPLNLNRKPSPIEEVLTKLSDPRFELGRSSNGAEELRIPEMPPFAQLSGTASGSLNHVFQNHDGADVMFLEGWAVSGSTRKPFDLLVATLNSHLLAVDKGDLERPDLAGKVAGINCGFRIGVPQRILQRSGQIRVFGLTLPTASEAARLEEVPLGVSSLNLTMSDSPPNVPLLPVVVQVKDGKLQVRAGP